MKHFALIFLLFSTSLLALPQQCIQRPERATPCEREFYRSASITNPDTGAKEKQVVCICMSDFTMLLNKPQNQTQVVQRKMELKMLSRLLDLPENEILDLIQY